MERSKFYDVMVEVKKLMCLFYLLVFGFGNEDKDFYLSNIIIVCFIFLYMWIIFLVILIYLIGWI